MAERNPFAAAFDRLKRAFSPTQTIGAPGTAIHGGYIQHNESQSRLTGRERYKTFSQILANVSIVAAGTRHFLNLVSRSPWRVDPANDSEAAKRIASLIEDMLFKDMKTPWHRVIRRASMYRFYGFSVQEWTAKQRDDGQIGYKDIAPRPQITIEQWDCNAEGEIEGVIQRRPQDQEELYLPRERVLYMVDDSLHDSPEGLGLFRHVAEAARRLQRLEQLEGYGYETDLRGIPVGRAPLALLKKLVDDGTISKDQKTAMEKEMKDFIEGHIRSPSLGMLIDSITYQSKDDAATPSNVRQWDMELLKGGGTSLPNIDVAIKRLNREIARVLGVEQMLLGENAVGSFAMARDKSEGFAMIVDGTMTELTETFDDDLLNPLMALNGWPRELKPSLKARAIQHRAVEEITKALADMASAGAILDPDDPAIDDVRELLGLSKRDVRRMAADAALGGRDGIRDSGPGGEPAQDGTSDPDDQRGDPERQ